MFRKITAVRGNETCSIFGPIPQFSSTINFLHFRFCVWPRFRRDCAVPLPVAWGQNRESWTVLRENLIDSLVEAFHNSFPYKSSTVGLHIPVSGLPWRFSYFVHYFVLCSLLQDLEIKNVTTECLRPGWYDKDNAVLFLLTFQSSPYIHL